MPEPELCAKVCDFARASPGAPRTRTSRPRGRAYATSATSHPLWRRPAHGHGRLETRAVRGLCMTDTCALTTRWQRGHRAPRRSASGKHRAPHSRATARPALGGASNLSAPSIPAAARPRGTGCCPHAPARGQLRVLLCIEPQGTCCTSSDCDTRGYEQCSTGGSPCECAPGYKLQWTVYSEGRPTLWRWLKACSSRYWRPGRCSCPSSPSR